MREKFVDKINKGNSANAHFLLRIFLFLMTMNTLPLHDMTSLNLAYIGSDGRLQALPEGTRCAYRVP